MKRSNIGIHNSPAGSSGEILATTRHDDLQWTYRSDCHDSLFGDGTPKWPALQQEPSAKMVKSNPMRQVFRVLQGDWELYVKVYFAPDWKTQLKWRIRGCPGENEFNHLQEARNRSVPSPRAVAWSLGKIDGQVMGVLITESLKTPKALSDFIWAEDSTENKKLPGVLTAAGQAVARLHRAGIEHHDLHAGNILIGNTDLGSPTGYIIDLQKVSIGKSEMRNTQIAKNQTFLKNTAVLTSELKSQLNNRIVRHFTSGYLKSLQPHRQWTELEIDHYFEQLNIQAEKYYRNFCNRRDRRAMRDSKYACAIDLPGSWIARVLLQSKHSSNDSPASQMEFTTSNWQEALAQPDAFINLANSQKIQVGQNQLNVTVKRYPRPRGLSGLKELFTISAAMQQWKQANGQITRQSSVAWPIAVLERWKYGFLQESFYIEEHIPGSSSSPDDSQNADLNADMGLTQATFENILIIKPSSLGDVVRCIPILSGCRKAYPNAKISWLVRPDCGQLLQGNPDLNEIIYFDRKHLGKFGRSFKATVDAFKFLGMLKKKKFDLVIDLQGLFRSGLMSYCTKAPIRMGFKNARELAPVFYTHKIAISSQREHVVDSYWRFAGALGFQGRDKTFNMVTPQDVERSSRELLEQSIQSPGSDYAVMLIGGTEEAKRWPIELFAKLADRLNSCYSINTILLGAGACEEALARQMIENTTNQKNVINLIGKTTLPQMVAILRKARFVVGNDSGPLHIAAALARPTIGIYGPTDAEVVGPYGQMDGVVRAGSNAPRTKRYSTLPEHQISRISIDDILEKIDQKINSNDSN